MKEAAGNAEKIRIMFEDEARFGRISDPRQCWAPKGTRPVVPRQFVREYTYAYAAVSPCDGILDSLVLPDVNAESMSIFLSIVSERHPDELILMFMDQAAWHKAKALEIPVNIKLLNLPPYSPELIPHGTSLGGYERKVVSQSCFQKHCRCGRQTGGRSCILRKRCRPGG